MIKQCVTSRSIGLCSQEILQFHVRRHKYIRCADQFKEGDDLMDFFVLHFLKKLGKTKIMRKLKLQTDPPSSDVKVKIHHAKSILKSHSQGLQSLDFSDLACLQSSSERRILLPVKHLKKLQIKGRESEIKDLRALKTLESLSINTRETNMKIRELKRSLMRLKNLKVLELSSYQADFGEVLKLLDQTTINNEIKRDFRIKVLKGDEPYANVSDISNCLAQKITQLELASITTIQPLESVLKNQFAEFKNLKELRLEFSGADINLAEYLKALENIPSLENLSLSFTESNSKEFSAAVISNLRLPHRLKDLELSMFLSLEDYILNNTSLIKHAKEKFQWREKNYFEDEPFFKSFFEMFNKAKVLRKIMFDFKMLDSFSSYYTSFFASILSRLPQLQSFALCVQDTVNQHLPNEYPESLDLALLLDSCSKMTDLQEFEVSVPNLLFENASISLNLSKLREFHISISNPEDNGLAQENKPLKFIDISNCLKKLLKYLVSSAPNLKSLILNIGEVMDDSTFCDRFKFITQFKNLEYLYLQVLVLKCSYEAIQNVGRSLQSMNKLKTLVLQFNASDQNTFALKTYINYHKSIKEVLFVSNTDIWWGDVACVKKI